MKARQARSAFSPRNRRLAEFLRLAEPAVDILALVLMTAALCAYLPLQILSANPATGGDTGSHYWTLHALAEYGLPNGTLRVWNPGNQCGEPRLVHYFPLPFMLMALAATVIPVGTAFNIGTILSSVLFPLAVYFAVRGLGGRFPTPILTAAFSFVFLCNESFSMWGGNILSTLAGQFAHSYGLVFLLLGMGRLSFELRFRRSFLGSALLFAAVTLSHGYAAFGIPFFFLLLLAHAKPEERLLRFKHCLFSGLTALALSLWFLVPMADNGRWTTKFTMQWMFHDTLNELVPEISYPVVSLIPVALLLWLSARLGWIKPCRATAFLYYTCFGLALCYIGLFFALPRLGLIDVRAIPQIQLFGCSAAAAAAADLLRRFGRIPAWLLTSPLILCVLFWTQLNVKNAGSWLVWNYTGWPVKPLYLQLDKVSKHLEGSFSDPRVIFELNAAAQATGSIRVFEMLPYFSRRSTLESVYLEATQLAPATVYMQALISTQPSCPLREYPCPHWDVEAAKDKLDLLAVGDLIIVSDKIREQAEAATWLTKTATFEPWHLYQTKKRPSYVEVLNQQPKVISRDSWRKEFYDWFVSYKAEATPLIAEDLKLPDASVYSTEGLDCDPQVAVDFNRIKLTTRCPGKAHYLKFSYHPSWKASNGEPIFLVSPGFMLIVPEREEVELVFGQRGIWRAADWVSGVTLLIVIGAGLVRGARGKG